MTRSSPTGALEKGLIVLQSFAQHSAKSRLELRDIAEITSLNKATVLRVLATLQSYGFIIRHSDQSYSVGAMANALGYRYRELFQTNILIEIAVQHINEQLNESVAFYVRDNLDRLCIYAKNSKRTIQHQFRIGKRIPLSSGGSAGHIIESYDNRITGKDMEKIRTEGYCITIEEREKEQSSISVPVFDGDGSFNGVIVVAGLKSRFDEKYMKEKILPVIHSNMQKAGLASLSLLNN